MAATKSTPEDRRGCNSPLFIDRFSLATGVVVAPQRRSKDQGQGPPSRYRKAQAENPWVPQDSADPWPRSKEGHELAATVDDVARECTVL